MSFDLCACIVSFLIYASLFAVYLIRIGAAKKALKEKSAIPQRPKLFFPILFLSCLLLFLPLLIPLRKEAMLSCLLCGILSLYLLLKERLLQIKSAQEEKR